MYIPRTTLWVLLILFGLAPSIKLWILSDISAWYRPYILWGILIIIVFISQQVRHKTERRQ
ncbi:hypothetical protein EDC56_3360 [Sinobacterium caligoides]|uniref:Uncharacterized protein n=1 Tax=Sinobacterium caligoides TaxID=933926 RepID=A0A3N2DFQ8_9GAMM|nr:hypothetical protein [Sinobacterium caligoides]ROR98630.1 hypothetical protein EDC56_3360 [Sinobacterium caligoides]